MYKTYKYLFGIILSFLIVQTAAAQSAKISGVVTEKANGQPIPGVSITVKGTNIGTQTDGNGKFSITAKPNDILRIVSIGYSNQELKITTATTFSVQLEEASNALSEVVVTALNIPKEKKSLGYSVQELKSKDLSEAKKRIWSMLDLVK